MLRSAQFIWQDLGHSSARRDVIIERLSNENENKRKTQMTQSFNQYSECETKIWR